MADHRRPVAVQTRGKGIRATRVGGDVGVAEAHRRFGGVDLPASLAGMLCALGTTVLIAGVVAGAGTVGYQRGLRGDDSTLSVAGLLGGLAVLLAAFLLGGWVAGRMARYDGVRNGVLTAVWFIVLAAVVAALGAWFGERYDFFARVDLPQWFSDDADTASAIGTGLLAVVVMLAAGAAGGWWGARYHRRADRLIVATRPGGVAAGAASSATVAPASDITDTASDITDTDGSSRGAREVSHGGNGRRDRLHDRGDRA